MSESVEGVADLVASATALVTAVTALVVALRAGHAAAAAARSRGRGDRRQPRWTVDGDRLAELPAPDDYRP